MFKNLFSKSTPAPDSSEPDPAHLAVAALFVEAARADENYDEREKALIDKSLAGMFSIAAEDAAALRAAGEKAQEGALDLQRFTRVAKSLPIAEKISFIEKLWEVVLSDGERDPYEDTLIRSICGLIYVDDRESGAARVRAEARLAGG